MRAGSPSNSRRFRDESVFPLLEARADSLSNVVAPMLAVKVLHQDACSATPILRPLVEVPGGSVVAAAAVWGVSKSTAAAVTRHHALPFSRICRSASAHASAIRRNTNRCPITRSPSRRICASQT